LFFVDAVGAAGRLSETHEAFNVFSTHLLAVDWIGFTQLMWANPLVSKDGFRPRGTFQPSFVRNGTT
jgi:hypothetical protein